MTSDAATAPRIYRSDRRAAQASSTRTRVIDAAMKIFRERGYAGTTMRDIAAGGAVSVPTVELMFGTKVGTLKAAIDVAIAGDDHAVAVLDRDWVREAADAASVWDYFDVVARVLAAAQARSAGLILAVFEAATQHPGLAELAQQLTAQRRATAEWVVATLSLKAPLRGELTRGHAVEALWVLMDPAMFDRVVRHLGWSTGEYQEWFARSARTLLVPDATAEFTSPPKGHRP